MKYVHEPKMRLCSCCGCDVLRRSRGFTTDSYFYDNRLSEANSQTKFYCCGSVPPTGRYRRRHGMSSTCFRNDKTIEFGLEAHENEYFGYSKIINPEVPYIGDLPEQLFLGRTVEIHGKVNDNANEFFINLTSDCSVHCDIAFHFNPRLDRRIIVRNHRLHKKWGHEEILSVHPFPFKLDKNFTLIFFVADGQFFVAVNKIHYCAFAFRIPVEKVKFLIIKGDISLTLIQHYDSFSYPPLTLSKSPLVVVPQTPKKDMKCVIKRRVKSIAPGTKIEITGKLKMLPTAFYINLQSNLEVWPHPIIPFHMNLRIFQPGSHKSTEEHVVFNRWTNGNWGQEDIVQKSPFQPGTPFNVVIYIKPTFYSVHVNSQLYHNYHIPPMEDSNALVVYGDVIISKVFLRY